MGHGRFHDLRHSAASLMLAQGVPLEIVSRILGHAGLAITADVYGAMGQKVLRRGAEAMDAALWGDEGVKVRSARCVVCGRKVRVTKHETLARHRYVNGHVCDNTGIPKEQAK